MQNVAGEDWFSEVCEYYGYESSSLLPQLFALEPGLVVSLNRAMAQGRPWKRVVRVLPIPSMCEVLNTVQRLEADDLLENINRGSEGGQGASPVGAAAGTIDTIQEVDEADYQSVRLRSVVQSARDTTATCSVEGGVGDDVSQFRGLLHGELDALLDRADDSSTINASPRASTARRRASDLMNRSISPGLLAEVFHSSE